MFMNSEYNIFSDLPDKVFESLHNVYMATFMTQLWLEYIDCLSEYTGDFKVPKLKYHFDDITRDETIVTSAYSDHFDAMLNLAFSHEPEWNTFSMIWNDGRNHYDHFGAIDFNKPEALIREAIDFIYQINQRLLGRACISDMGWTPSLAAATISMW